MSKESFKVLRVPGSLFSRIQALADLNECGPNDFGVEILEEGLTNYWGSILAEVHRRKREKHKVRRGTPIAGSLLDHVLQVMGDRTMTFSSICDALELNGWMPERRSSVSNVFQKDSWMFTSLGHSTYKVKSTSVK